MNKKIIILILTILIFQNGSTLFAASQNIDSTKNINSSTKADSSTIKEEKIFYWCNSPYLALGYGYPQGLRLETGYNIFTYFSLVLTYTINAYWLKHSENGLWETDNKMIGLIGRIFLPYKTWDVTPYLQIGRGFNFNVFGSSNSYTNFYIGTMIPVTKWLQLRPEFGIDFTSKHISGGLEIPSWGPNPEVKEDKTWFGLNLSFELDFLAFFR